MHSILVISFVMMVTLYVPAAKAQTCAPLTIANLSQDYLVEGSVAFMIDDQGLAVTPLYLALTGSPNPQTGAFSGTISTGYTLSATVYDANGTITQTGTNVVAITFTYSYLVYSAPGLLARSYTYNYTGAAVVVSQTCQLFFAGTYTVTSTFFESPEYHTATTGPYPFSSKLFWFIDK